MKHKIFIADYLHFALCAARNTFTYKLKASDVKILSLPEERQFQAILFSFYGCLLTSNKGHLPFLTFKAANIS